MSVYVVPPEAVEETYAKMSPRYMNTYKKSNEPIFVPNHETLNGLAVASEVTGEPDELESPKEFYTSYTELLKDAEVKKTLPIGKPIVFTGKIGSEEYVNKITTYGRLRLSKIIDADIDKVGIFKKPYERIGAGSGAKLYQYLYQFPDGIEKINELQKYALLVVTRAGVVTFDFKTLFTDVDTKTYQELRRISDSPDYTDKQKLLLMNELYKTYLKELEGTFTDELKDELSRAARVKLASIVEMVAPSLIISGVDEKPIINQGSLISGLTEKDYNFHAIENRSLQSIKVMGVPSSGYLTRQLSFLMNNFRFTFLSEDPDNDCIMIPRYKALGRVAPGGKRYPEKPITNPDEEDLVQVRSIIVKKVSPDMVTPDLIGSKFKDLSEGTAIGLSFGTSLTESITQAALGLKHGGHERVIDETGYLRAPKAGKVKEDGKWLILESRGSELIYPRPQNLVLTGKSTVSAGDIIGTAYTTTSPIFKLNALIKLMRATGSDGVRYFEKDNVIVSDCYALESGKISYSENQKGEIEVSIGSHRYNYNPDCMYYFPSGTEVRKFQRICSGVVNMGTVVSSLGNDLNGIYQVFRRQFYSLVDKGYVKSGVTDLSGPQEELVEMLFTSLSKVERSLETSEIEKIQYQGTYSGIMNNDSFYTILSYGYASRVMSRALKGELGFKNDVMTETVLGLLLDNKLDKDEPS